MEGLQAKMEGLCPKMEILTLFLLQNGRVRSHMSLFIVRIGAFRSPVNGVLPTIGVMGARVTAVVGREGGVG